MSVVPFRRGPAALTLREFKYYQNSERGSFVATRREHDRPPLMPEPIQSSSVAHSNQSYYDPADDVSRVPSPSASAAPAKAAPAQDSAASTSKPPGGKDVLLAKYGAGGQDCATYLASAGTALVVAGASAAVGIATAPSGIGAVTGLAGTIGGIVNSAINIAGYLNCEEKNDQARVAAAECSSKGGALVAGAGDSDAVCITPRQ